jgi:hypothetical protein
MSNLPMHDVPASGLRSLPACGGMGLPPGVGGCACIGSFAAARAMPPAVAPISSRLETAIPSLLHPIPGLQKSHKADICINMQNM